MLVSDLITWCKDQFERGIDTLGDKLSDSQWIMYFNDALSDLQPILELEVASTANTIVGVGSYGLPTDFYRPVTVLVNDGTTYKIVPRGNINGYGYRTWAGEIIINPAPSLAVENGLKLYYYRKVTSITAATETIEIEDPYLLGYYAMARAESGDRDLDASNNYYAQYLARKNSINRHNGQEHVTNVTGW